MIGFGLVDGGPSTRGKVCWRDCFDFFLDALRSNWCRMRVNLEEHQGRGLTNTRARLSSCPSTDSSPLSSLDINETSITFFRVSFRSGEIAVDVISALFRDSSFYKKKKKIQH